MRKSILFLATFSLLYFSSSISRAEINIEQANEYWQTAQVKLSEGDNLEAEHWARRAVKADPENKKYLLEFAYILIANNKNREANMYFEKALENYEPEQKDLLEAAYLNKKLGINDRLKSYLERYINNEQTAVKNGKILTLDEQAKLYYAKREYADLIRFWGSKTNVNYTNVKGDDRIQAMQEFYIQPYYNNGQTWQIYTQYHRPLYSSTNGADNNKLSYATIGTRFEPIAAYDLALILEQAIKIGSMSENDTRWKLAFTWDDGLEKNPIRDNWNYTTVFAEFTHSLDKGNQFFTYEFRQGYAYKLLFNTILYPHVFISGDYNSDGLDNDKKSKDYVGPGLHLRQWYREEYYAAPRSNLDIIVQYKVGLNHSDDIFMINVHNNF